MKIKRSISLPLPPLSQKPTYEQAALHRLDQQILDKVDQTTKTVESQIRRLEKLDGSLMDSDPAPGKVRIGDEDSLYVRQERARNLNKWGLLMVPLALAAAPLGVAAAVLGSVPLALGAVGATAGSMATAVFSGGAGRPDDESARQVLDENISQFDGSLTRSASGAPLEFSLEESSKPITNTRRTSTPRPPGHGDVQYGLKAEGDRRTYLHKEGFNSVIAEFDQQAVSVTLEVHNPPLLRIPNLDREGYQVVGTAPFAPTYPGPRPRTHREQQENQLRQAAWRTRAQVLEVGTELRKLDESEKDLFAEPGRVVVAQHPGGRNINGELTFDANSNELQEMRAVVGAANGPFFGFKAQDGVEEFYLHGEVTVVDRNRQEITVLRKEG